jgi:hypothetical protein
MIKIALLVASILMASCGLASAQVVKSGPYVPLGYCQITSLASAVALVTASCSTGAVPNGAVLAEICVETAGVRYRDDGISPTASLGMPVIPTSTTPVCYAYAIIPMTAVKFIAISGSPVIDVLFYALN